MQCGGVVDCLVRSYMRGIVRIVIPNDADFRFRRPGKMGESHEGNSSFVKRYFVSAISSISTHDPKGTCATPKAVRACAPPSPKTSISNSEAPLATRCCSVKPGALLTSTINFTIRPMLSRFSAAACSVPIKSMATLRAACFPSEVLSSAPSFPTQGLPSRLAMWPLKNMSRSLFRKGTKAATGAVGAGRAIPSCFNFSDTDISTPIRLLLFVIPGFEALQIDGCLDDGSHVPSNSDTINATFAVKAQMQNPAAPHSCPLLAVEGGSGL